MVTIIGGGIAGTVLAGALARNQHPVTVYERQTTTGTGAFVVLDGHAHQSMVELGVPLDALHAASHEVPGFRFHYLPDGRNAVRSQGHRLYARTELMRVLSEFAASAATDIRYDTPITDLDPTTATIYSGTTPITSDDLIIAADGIDSTARARLEPDRQPEYAGQVVIYGSIDQHVDLPSEPSLLHFHGQLGTGPLPTSTFGHMWNDHSAYWFTRITQAPIPQEDIGFHPTERWAQTVRTADPTATELIDTILANTDTVHISNARNVAFTDAREPQLPVVLCGDADHAITPAAARGAREAIEDGAALYRAIIAGDSPAEAMAERRTQITTERDQLARVYSRARA
ncbi:FAD-dependent monooxygenase [Nocardia nepalensis]|uniref:FAD-dependent monooxygenase n=1 Tax=Nocardia nepalensis TaxID=3375448 RepID=UPI003B67DB08